MREVFSGVRRTSVIVYKLAFFCRGSKDFGARGIASGSLLNLICGDFFKCTYGGVCETGFVGRLGFSGRYVHRSLMCGLSLFSEGRGFSFGAISCRKCCCQRQGADVLRSRGPCGVVRTYGFLSRIGGRVSLVRVSSSRGSGVCGGVVCATIASTIIELGFGFDSVERSVGCVGRLFSTVPSSGLGGRCTSGGFCGTACCTGGGGVIVSCVLFLVVVEGWGV